MPGQNTGSQSPSSVTRRNFLIRTGQFTAAYGALGLIEACSNGGSSGSKSTALRIGIAQGLLDPDPHTTSYLTDTQLLQNIYRGLTIRDSKTLKPTADIAQSWDISPDQLTWTFKLRSGVKFHNGRDLVADDVKFSIDRIMDPGTKASAASYFTPVDRVDVIDPRTVAFRLKQPYSILDEALLQTYSAIVPKEAVANLKTQPVGTGPFQFVSQVAKTSVTLKKFQDYWDKPRPYLAELRYQVIPDESAKLAALSSNQIDFSNTVPFEQVKSLKGKSGIKVVQFKSSWVDEFGLNCKRPPFSDVRVRQAIAMALKKDDIATAATVGLGGPMDTMVAPSSPVSVSVKGLPYDPQGAKRLLAEAGLQNGFTMEFAPCGGTAYPQMIRASQVIADQLQAIGIKAKATTLEGAVWGDQVVSKHDYSGFVCGLVAGLDPDQHSYPYFRSDGTYNFSQYGSTSELDQLLAQGRQVRDSAQRSQIYTKAWDILAKEVPWIPLYYVPGLVAMRDNVQGFNPLPEFDLRFETVQFT